MNYWIDKKTKEKNGELLATVHGVDFGVIPVLWEMRPIGNPKYIVLKIKGGPHWTGRGMPWKYAATYFQVLHVIEEREDMWLCEEVIDFPLRLSKSHGE